jgi:prevent-host-death family protein
MAMKSVRIAELKDHLSEHLRAVERGSEVEVTDRGRPIARIVPLPAGGPRPRLVVPRREFREFRERHHPPAGWPVDSSDLLAEERRERRP